MSKCYFGPDNRSLEKSGNSNSNIKRCKSKGKGKAQAQAQAQEEAKPQAMATGKGTGKGRREAHLKNDAEGMHREMPQDGCRSNKPL